MMGKYVRVLFVSWQRIFIYREVTLLYLGFSLINILLGISVWVVAARSPVFNSDVPLATFILYYILVIVFNPLVHSYTSGMISEQHIKRGELSVYLLKPFSYFGYILMLEIPWRIMQFLMSLPVAAILIILFRDTVVIRPWVIMSAILLTPFAYLLSFLVQVMFAYLTFWFEESKGFLNLLEVATILFSGVGIPLFFFPPFLERVSLFLPFRYVLYFPVTVAMQQVNSTEFITSCSVMIVWILAAGIAVRWMWKKGVRQFTGEGI
jgi:ABC-2 type transport system permease protein